MHTAPRPQSPVSPKWGHRLCPHCVSVCNVCLYVCMSFPCLGCHPRFACSCSCVFLYRVGVHPIAAGAYKAAALARCACLFTGLDILPRCCIFPQLAFAYRSYPGPAPPAAARLGLPKMVFGAPSCPDPAVPPLFRDPAGFYPALLNHITFSCHYWKFTALLARQRAMVDAPFFLQQDCFQRRNQNR